MKSAWRFRSSGVSGEETSGRRCRSIAQTGARVRWRGSSWWWGGGQVIRWAGAAAGAPNAQVSELRWLSTKAFWTLQKLKIRVGDCIHKNKSVSEWRLRSSPPVLYALHVLAAVALLLRGLAIAGRLLHVGQHVGHQRLLQPLPHAVHQLLLLPARGGHNRKWSSAGSGGRTRLVLLKWVPVGEREDAKMMMAQANQGKNI